MYLSGTKWCCLRCRTHQISKNGKLRQKKHVGETEKIALVIEKLRQHIKKIEKDGTMTIYHDMARVIWRKILRKP